MLQALILFVDTLVSQGADQMKMDPQTLQRFKNATKDDEVVFLFMPSANLKQKLAQGNDPILNQIPKQHIEALFYN